MDDTPGSRVRAAVEEALAIEDPAGRARAITEILAVMQDWGPEMKHTRRTDVQKLRETLVLREVAELIGTSISRVDQIEKGKS
ncbi:hypothetical protein [Streptomyces sp. NPDC055243]|uniref:hypothetical protein n=1 Tax=Streptomyces sp. NPDC055243 TaxID=3365720 RepID=UPI0037D81833